MADRLDFGMPLSEAMETQRAIRRLKPDPVDDELVLRLIGLALRAPTASNSQGWEFIVVRDPKIKKALARLNQHSGDSMRGSADGLPVTTRKGAGCLLPFNGRPITLKSTRSSLLPV